MAKKVKVKIEELMEKYGIKSISELSEKTGIRRAALSELANGKRQRIDFGHIEKIEEAFKIEDIREIIDFDQEKTTS
ncbi:helix-turn-helix domain-containing protein [Bacillus taeanensis]|uniref:XRE family transcriptional regulator n=1 Tax=Bacillus taeanensis TaxID=273032 RepID=A0A366XV78_9BACI|nr:helix-turn-helix transcriptional regulator [Bacillus taeanensis]RBW69478.1 XRE family transcriptional regulator [Bacillus taeanensis]